MANDYKGVSSIIALKFYEDLSAVDDTAATVTPCGGYTDQDLCMPFAGSIVGIAAEHVTAATVDLTLQVYAGSTALNSIDIAEGAAGDGQETYQPGTYPFAVDDDIIVYASLGEGATTTDAYGATSVWVFVQVGSSGT